MKTRHKVATRKEKISSKYPDLIGDSKSHIMRWWLFYLISFDCISLMNYKQRGIVKRQIDYQMTRLPSRL